MEDDVLKESKQERGCLFVMLIVLMSFAGAGIFFFAVGKFIGEDYRHLVFFGIMGLAIAVFLGREILKK